MHRVAEPFLGEHVGQVHEGPGDAGDRNRIDEGTIRLVQPA
jgi:hypothetical protein